VAFRKSTGRGRWGRGEVVSTRPGITINERGKGILDFPIVYGA